MKVLIVEDDLLVADHLETLVVSFGYEVCATASSAPEAVQKAAMHIPDVALMDIRLARGSSGINAASEIYSRQGLRCIFLSANLDHEIRLKLDALEPIEFIDKPILPVLLRRALQLAEKTICSHQI
jgi:two-component system, response regulator PdtaR